MEILIFWQRHKVDDSIMRVLSNEIARGIDGNYIWG